MSELAIPIRNTMMPNVELERQIQAAKDRRRRLNAAVAKARMKRLKPVRAGTQLNNHSFNDHVRLWIYFNSSLALKKLARRYNVGFDEVYREINPSIYSALNRPTMENVLKEVAVRHDFDYHKLRHNNSRSKIVSRARQEFCYLAVKLGRWSTPMIGRFINRDHTTVIHSVNRHCEVHGLPHPNTGKYIIKQGYDLVSKNPDELGVLNA